MLITQTTHIFEAISDHVWRTRYGWCEPGRVPEPSPMPAWPRVRCRSWVSGRWPTRGTLPHFNLSVAVTDDFMRAVEQDSPWPLVFPLGLHPMPVGGEVCERVWSGDTTPQLCLVHRRIPARVLWDKLLAAQLASAEPGILFIGRKNRDNNLWYGERITQLGALKELNQAVPKSDRRAFSTRVL